MSWLVRLSLLAGATFIAVGGPAPLWVARVFPSLSPLAALCSSIAGRGWYTTLAWSVAPLAVLLLAIWKGRFFCHHICPAGTLYALAGKIGKHSLRNPLKNKTKPVGEDADPPELAKTPPIFSWRDAVPGVRWRLNGILFWSIIAGAIVGLPFFLPLDPLSTFNRTLTPASFPGDRIAWIAGGVLPLFMILGAIQPMVWCARLCPLGYGFDLVRRLRVSRVKPQQEGRPNDPIRRDILIGIGLGVPLAWLIRQFGFSGKHTPTIPVLPPGADSVERFSGACTRCYACVQKCPSKVIRLQPLHLTIPATAFLPRLDMDKGSCAQYCNDCTQVCPTGALTPLSMDEKQTIQIGVATVNHEACLAWADGEHCMVCQEFCPYRAITDSPSPSGIPRPVVQHEKCRGCGACQNQCPAIRIGKAIHVQGVLDQKRLAL